MSCFDWTQVQDHSSACNTETTQSGQACPCARGRVAGRPFVSRSIPMRVVWPDRMVAVSCPSFRICGIIACAGGQSNRRWRVELHQPYAIAILPLNKVAHHPVVSLHGRAVRHGRLDVDHKQADSVYGGDAGGVTLKFAHVDRVAVRQGLRVPLIDARGFLRRAERLGHGWRQAGMENQGEERHGEHANSAHSRDRGALHDAAQTRRAVFPHHRPPCGATSGKGNHRGSCIDPARLCNRT